MKVLSLLTVLLFSVQSFAMITVKNKDDQNEKMEFQCVDEKCDSLKISRYFLYAGHEPRVSTRTMTKKTLLEEKRDVPWHIFPTVGIPNEISIHGLDLPYIRAGVTASSYLFLYPLTSCALGGEVGMCVLAVPGLAATVATMPLGLAIDVVKGLLTVGIMGPIMIGDHAVRLIKWNRAFNKALRLKPDSKDKVVKLEGGMYRQYSLMFYSRGDQ